MPGAFPSSLPFLESGFLSLKLTDWLDWPESTLWDPSASTSARITGISWLFTWAPLPGPVCPFFSTVQYSTVQ